MFSRNWPEPDAHWLVILYESTLPRSSIEIARPLSAPMSTTARAAGSRNTPPRACVVIE